jgi:hypothetical protein
MVGMCEKVAVLRHGSVLARTRLDRAVLLRELEGRTDGRNRGRTNEELTGMRDRTIFRSQDRWELDTEQSLQQVNERLDDDGGSDGGDEEDVHLGKPFLHTTLPSDTPISTCANPRKL